jgi:Kef-type K+ transport system membrane component KefB
VPGQVPVHDVIPFATWVAVVSAAGLLAVWSNRIAEVLRVPAPALFLVAAAVVAAVVPSADDLGVVGVQRVVTVMLVLLLFDGGLHLGWRRLRPAVAAVAWVGVMGTFVTTAGIALVAHLLGFDWRPALLLGVALAPTDPAVVFSVLGRREVGGRTGTILEGESGANDPVGIAAMAAVLAAGSAGSWHAVGSGVRAGSSAAGCSGGRCAGSRCLAAPSTRCRPCSARVPSTAGPRCCTGPASSPSSWPACCWATCGRRTSRRSSGSTPRSPASPRSSPSPCSGSRSTSAS